MDFILSTCKGKVINSINRVINLLTAISTYVSMYVDIYQ